MICRFRSTGSGAKETLGGFTSTYDDLVGYTFKTGHFTSQDEGVSGTLTMFHEIGAGNLQVFLGLLNQNITLSLHDVLQKVEDKLH